MKLEQSILIEATPEQIWPYVADPEKLLTWYLPLEAFEYTSEQLGGVGATFTVVEKAPIGRMKMTFKVTEWVENQRFAFDKIDGPFLKRYNQRFAIEPMPEGSSFRFYEEAEFPYGPLGRLLGSIAQQGSQSNLRQMLAKLKELVEAEAETASHASVKVDFVA